MYIVQPGETGCLIKRNRRQIDFYPTAAQAPEGKRTNRLLLRPLRTTDVSLDYDAVMSSCQQLRCWSQSTWPSDDFTLEQNLDDLRRLEREHGDRKEFTYTVHNPSSTRCLGCVYIFPLWSETEHLCTGATCAAGVRFWIRTSEVSADLDKHLFTTLRDWFIAEWPFECIVFAASPQDVRQLMVFGEADFKSRAAFTLLNGQVWHAFCFYTKELL